MNSILTLVFLFFLCVFVVNRIAFFASSAGVSRMSAKATFAIFARWHSLSHPLHSCHFGGNEGISRRHKMTIRRIAPSLSSLISAEVVQLVQNLQYFANEVSPLGRITNRLSYVVLRARR